MKHKQKQPFYLVTEIGNLDGSVDLSWGEPNTFDSVETALVEAKDQTGEHGMRTYVYKCVPIYQINRGRLRIKKL